MGIISGIFKRSASEGPPGPMVSVTSFVCIHEDPQFCVVRVTASEAGALDDELLELHVVAGRRTHRFLPTERRSFDQAPQDGRTAEFVLPVSVLGSDNFTLHLSSVEVRLGRPPRADDGGLPASSGTIADAFLSQQNRLAFQVRKLAELRSELRGERDTASRAEEELEEARERFNKSLLGQREENHALVERAEKAEAAAERDRAEREKIEAERQDWLTPVKQELQSSRAHAADLQKEMQALATGLQEERAAREAAAADLERERAARESAETQRDDAKRLVAELERENNAIDERRASLESELAEARGMLDEQKAALAKAEEQVTELKAAAADLDAARAELHDARTGLEHEAGERRDAERRLDDAEQKIAELVRETEQIDERRASVESELAEARTIAREERAANSEAQTRAQAAETVLKETRRARDRAEQRVRELEEMFASRFSSPPPESAAGGATLEQLRGQAAGISVGLDPTAQQHAEELLAERGAGDSNFDLADQTDKELANAFDVALRSWASRDRVGAYGEADRWRELAVAIVAQASTRPSFTEDEPSDRGRLRLRRRDRLEEQLRDACRQQRSVD